MKTETGMNIESLKNPPEDLIGAAEAVFMAFFFPDISTPKRHLTALERQHNENQKRTIKPRNSREFAAFAGQDHAANR